MRDMDSHLPLFPLTFVDSLFLMLHITFFHNLIFDKPKPKLPNLWIPIYSHLIYENPKLVNEM